MDSTTKGVQKEIMNWSAVTNNKRRIINGPFTIWIQPDCNNDKEKQKSLQVSPYKVGNLICKKYHSIDYISSKSKSRVEVNFKNTKEANQLIDDPILKVNNLKVFIPSFRLTRRDLIKGIDEDIIEEEILKELESEFQILRVRRLNKRNRDPNKQEGDPKWMANKSVVITFSGQNLPTVVYLYKIYIKSLRSSPIRSFPSFVATASN
ncbi:uncharacterized protein [Mycetomoellerius zeteki]|uniref:uncharacterized protein isoform X2 n=1 Tax=Mycetomoellerius zeteki TaxID=64791 RepID=UPI00084E47CC|nr:PREDICTED: uncharacterized protein LOC108732040 isoform X2 [Trachymyrmex zeteki]